MIHPKQPARENILFQFSPSHLPNTRPLPTHQSCAFFASNAPPDCGRTQATGLGIRRGFLIGRRLSGELLPPRALYLVPISRWPRTWMLGCRDGMRSGSSSIDTVLARNSSSRTRASSRASRAPTQKCDPCPKARWSWGFGRSRLSRSGSE